MFEDFSERARRIVFFWRVLAGQRGAAAIEVEDLMQALLFEDQADYAHLFLESAVPGAARMALPPHRPFFKTEVAAEIQRGLKPLMLSKTEPLPTSVEMPLSESAQRVLLGAMELSKELRGEPATPSRMQVGHVEPLHLLAAVLSDEASATAEVLKQAGTTKETVIAAIKSGEYS